MKRGELSIGPSLLKTSTIRSLSHYSNLESLQKIQPWWRMAMAVLKKFVFFILKLVCLAIFVCYCYKAFINRASNSSTKGPLFIESEFTLNLDSVHGGTYSQDRHVRGEKAVPWGDLRFLGET